MHRLLCLLYAAVLLSGCVAGPAPTATLSTTVQDLLYRAVQENLAAYPRPQPFRDGNIPLPTETDSGTITAKV